jgi:hypothetical protein
MLRKIKKAVFITLAGLFLLFGTGLDQFAVKSTAQSQQATEESIETEIDQAIETKRHTLRKARKSSVSFFSIFTLADSAPAFRFSLVATPSLQSNKYLLYRSLLI